MKYNDFLFRYYLCGKMAQIETNHMTSFGALNLAMIAAERSRLKLEAGGSFVKCITCSKVRKDNKRCTGCYMVWYCGQDCQMKGWDEHKVECKKTRKEYKTVKLLKTLAETRGLDREDMVEVGYSFTNGIKTNNNNKPADTTKKSHFVVKVQIDMFSELGPMFIYNQDRDLQGYLCFKENEKVYDELKQQIRSKGFGGLQNLYSAGLKGYFQGLRRNEDQTKSPLECR